jgi:Reverse transcriptase (RNA-dependent DNA polymerase)
MSNFNLEDSLTNTKLIKSSIYYAIHSRLNNDHFCNFFELNINCKNNTKIEQLAEYIRNIYSLSQPYIQDESFTYAYPKADFFIRRCTYLPFKEYAVRYHLINTLSLAVENSFIKTSYANRTQRSQSGFICLFKEYKPEHEKFIKWAKNFVEEFKKEKKESYLLNADITSFYDSVPLNYLINTIFDLTGSILPQKYEPLFYNILQPKIEFYSIIDGLLKSEKKHQGLLIGNITDGYLANILLNRIDELMISQGLNYARYVDDIKIITNTKDEILKAVNILQEELHRIGLNLNSAKTEIIHNPKSLKDFFRKDNQIYFDDLIIEEKLEDEKSEDDHKDNINHDIKEINISLDLQQQDCIKITNYLFDLEIYHNYDEKWVIQLIAMIPDMVNKYPKTIKKNTWNIVKFITFGFSNTIIIVAYKAMNEIFKNKDIMDYARTRLIHHLVKPRKKDPPYILMMVKNNERLRDKLIPIFQDFLSTKSIDLNLNSLYALWILSHQENGNTFDETLFRETIENHLPRPISHTLSRVLASILSYKDSLNFVDYFDFKDLSDNSENVGLDDLGYQ